MEKEKRYELSRLIRKSTGLTIQEYCRNELKVNEKTFYYRLRNGMIYFTDLFKILDKGIDIEVFRSFAKHTKKSASPKTKQEPTKRNDASKDKETFTFIEI